MSDVSLSKSPQGSFIHPSLLKARLQPVDSCIEFCVAQTRAQGWRIVSKRAGSTYLEREMICRWLQLQPQGRIWSRRRLADQAETYSHIKTLPGLGLADVWDREGDCQDCLRTRTPVSF